MLPGRRELEPVGRGHQRDEKRSVIALHHRIKRCSAVVVRVFPQLIGRTQHHAVDCFVRGQQFFGNAEKIRCVVKALIVHTRLPNVSWIT
jgi:hypothetical protein